MTAKEESIISDSDVSEVRPGGVISPDAAIERYTHDEIREAQIEAETIKRDLAMVGRMTFTAVEHMVEFQKKEYYEPLGMQTMDEFLNSIQYAPSTYRKYVRVYNVLTGKLGIDRRKYETVDIGKIVNIEHFATALEAAKLGVEKQQEAVFAAIEESWDLGIGDLIVSNEQKVLRLSAGLDMDGGKSTGGVGDQIIQSPLEYLEKGVFKLVPISPSERDGDPRHNSGLIKVNGHRSRMWFNSDTKLFTVEIP